MTLIYEDALNEIGKQLGDVEANATIKIKELQGISELLAKAHFQICEQRKELIKSRDIWKARYNKLKKEVK